MREIRSLRKDTSARSSAGPETGTAWGGEIPELWAGIDAGKAEHHCTVIDADGAKVLSRRVPNSEPELLDLVRDVLELAEDCPVTWAVDLNAGGAALLIALLLGHGQRLLYLPGRTVHHASAS